MNSKFTLALIALIGVGVFALPSTMALFAGQHTFYNIDATGNQVPCVKCHGDVKMELSGPTAVAGSQAPHAQFRCEYCHRAEAGAASGDDAYASIRYSEVGGTTNLTLITTIEMFETGNFPKVITYPADGTPLTVDNWNVACSGGNCVFGLDGVTAFVNQTEFLPDGKYPGNLSTTIAVPGAMYNVSRMSETSTRNADGTPKDTTAGTQNNAFDPRKVTFSGVTGTTVSLAGAGSSEVTPGTRYHAASLVSCMECHGGEQMKGYPGYEIESAEPYKHSGWLLDATDPTGSTCNNCHYGNSGHLPGEGFLAAGGFQGVDGLGLTTKDAIEGSVEAHNEFVTQGSNGVLRNASAGYGASNIACVACHTHVATEIKFQKKYALYMYAQGTDTGNWTVSGHSAKGTVDVLEFGNATGGAWGTGNKTYNIDAPTGSDTIYINGTGTMTGLTNTLNDSAQALTQ